MEWKQGESLYRFNPNANFKNIFSQWLTKYTDVELADAEGQL